MKNEYLNQLTQKIKELEKENQTLYINIEYHHKRVIICAALLVAVIMSVYELVKVHFFTHITMWQSHIATIIFATFIITFATHFVLSYVARLRHQNTDAIKTLREISIFNDSIIKAIPYGMDIVDEEGNIIYLNEKLEALVGEDALGKKCWQVYRNKDEQCEECPLRADTKNGSIEVEGILGNRVFDISHVEMQHDGRKLMLEILSDITARKQVEEQLRKLSRAVEQSPCSVVITDINGNIEYVNPKFTHLTGYTFEEAIGKNPRVLKSGEQPIEVYKNLWETVLSGKEWRGEFHNKKKNGELYWEIASISPVKNSDGIITHLLAVKEDITELKQVEEDLRKAKEAAETANQAKSQFLANMSHEIRTPMNGILGMTELLLGTKLTNEQKEYLDLVSFSAQSLLQIINDILDFSKIEAGKLELESIEFDLRHTIEQVVSALAIKAHDKGLEFISYLPPEIPVKLVGDPGRLRQILINLISNAIKFTEKGKIVIHIDDYIATNDQIKYKFSISDTGIGIAEHKTANLFKSFSQLDDSIARKYGGTGLGLSITKQLIEMMDGDIWVESKEGIGSIFYFTVKFLLQPHNLLAQEQLVNEHNTIDLKKPDCFNAVRNNIRILLAEDNMVNRKLASALLTKKDWQVESVTNGREAVEALETQGFDVVLMDIQMPEMDGFEATSIIRKKEIETGRHIPIIALTAYAIKGDRERCLNAGMDDYVAKPIKADELYSAIERVLRKAPSMEQVILRKSTFNLSSLLSTLGGDKELLGELVEDFLQDSTRSIAEIGAALENNDTKELGLKAHGLKGAAGNFGLKDIYALAYELEKAAKDNRIDGINDIFAKLKEEMYELQQYFSGSAWKENL